MVNDNSSICLPSQPGMGQCVDAPQDKQKEANISSVLKTRGNRTCMSTGPERKNYYVHAVETIVERQIMNLNLMMSVLNANPKCVSRYECDSNPIQTNLSPQENERVAK